MSKNEWKTLIEVYDRGEAEIIKAALEAQGIHAELFQEAAGAVYGLSVGLLGKIEIAVRATDLEAAQAWLNDYQNDAIPLPGEESPDE